MIRIGEFMAEYEKQLTEVVKADKLRPIEHQEYRFPVEFVPVVVDRMKDAIQRGSYNKDGDGFKRTCKALGIKHTYMAINTWLNNRETA
jgi:hypothetical protein